MTRRAVDWSPDRSHGLTRAVVAAMAVGQHYPTLDRLGRPRDQRVRTLLSQFHNGLGLGPDDGLRCGQVRTGGNSRPSGPE